MVAFSEASCITGTRPFQHGVKMVAYHKAILAESVYNDICDLMELLERLEVVSGVHRRVTHQFDVVYMHTLQVIANRYTRKANADAMASDTVSHEDHYSLPPI